MLCVGQNTASPASQTDGTKRQPASGEAASSSQGGQASSPDRTRRPPATGAAGASSSRRVDPELSASWLQTLKDEGLVPITPDNEANWYDMLSRSISENGKVRREALVKRQSSSPGLCFLACITLACDAVPRMLLYRVTLAIPPLRLFPSPLLQHGGGASAALLETLITLFCEIGGDINRIFSAVNGWALLHSAAR